VLSDLPTITHVHLHPDEKPQVQRAFVHQYAQGWPRDDQKHTPQLYLRLESESKGRDTASPSSPDAWPNLQTSEQAASAQTRTPSW
jgi:hypothetical protein